MTLVVFPAPIQRSVDISSTQKGPLSIGLTIGRTYPTSDGLLHMPPTLYDVAPRIGRFPPIYPYCVDHMRRAHDIPPVVKAANLACWFPPWTVTREQWTSMTRLAISGVAVDTQLFSHIGVPLFHCYRVVNRSGTHGAFRGSYMRRLHAFLEESDATSLRRRHRRCAQDLVARMSRTSLRDTEDRTADVSPRPKVTRRSSLLRPEASQAGEGAGSSRTTGSVCPHRSEANTVQVLMDLALPRVEGLGDGPCQVHRPWKISAELPASPDTSSVADR